ncbi:MAG: hypothetical protein AVDCRST_MAG49-3643 [uncultured Thermomicrobiales bacterium]|uniref:DUF1622 domain-containing protein n=1 Tax=uncultured Thermomicrobiales bacterium TaxID=1645740 RepID=A0A6J4V9T3_9BACT|nr:MAG: hypothetical protein AVDCRST_MAG49-3643 [uncultured Thermomicrobiales bacterium]
MTFTEAVELVGRGVDATGVTVIVVGMLWSTALYAMRWRGGTPLAHYRRYRQAIGRAILLGLEFLIAADIIRTVAIDPTFHSVGILAVIVAIRTFLSVELELEIDGRWPWEQRASNGEPDEVGEGAKQA